MNEKYCKQCKKWKILLEFGKNKNSKDGLTYKCKECRNFNQTENYLKNSPAGGFIWKYKEE